MSDIIDTLCNHSKISTCTLSPQELHPKFFMKTWEEGVALCHTKTEDCPVDGKAGN